MGGVAPHVFNRAASWNGSDKLLQLADHLRGKVIQEWGLLSDTQRSTYAIATTEIQNRLNPGSKMIAVQEFRHMAQKATSVGWNNHFEGPMGENTLLLRHVMFYCKDS